jgi:hypothetical protein
MAATVSAGQGSPRGADAGSVLDLLETVTEGCSSHQLFAERKNCYAYTFDDVIVLPGHMNFGIGEGQSVVPLVCNSAPFYYFFVMV